MPATQILVALAFLTALIGPVQARTFSDNKGQKIEAVLLAVSGTQVTIKKGGRRFTLPITEFSAADQSFIRTWASRKAEAEEKARTAQTKITSVVTPTPGKPKPGGTLHFSFPTLEKDFNGKPAAFSARIPKSYDPAKPVPLFIFLGGGKGSGSPGGALSLTDGDFVCIGLPYPDSGRSPWQQNMVGRVDRVWNYWKPMLATLNETVPNLDPNIRVIGGFSNGAHALDGLLGIPEFSSTFSAFVLIEGGGGPAKPFRGAKGKHIYYAWGEKSPIANGAGSVVSRARQGQMKLRSHEMKATGHQFPSTEKTAVKSWLYKTVLPDLRRR